MGSTLVECDSDVIRSGRCGSFWPLEQSTLLKPLLGGLLVGADEKDLLDGARCAVKTLEPGLGGILQLKTSAVPLAHLDPTRDDAAHLWAIAQDRVTDLIET